MGFFISTISKSTSGKDCNNLGSIGNPEGETPRYSLSNNQFKLQNSIKPKQI